VGKLQGSLKPLKERYKLHMFPSVLASRFLDVPGLYKGQACTEFGHAERPELWRRAPTNVLSTPGDLGSKCSQHPQDSKGNLPQDVKRKKERSKPTGVYLHTCCWQARPRDHNSKATPTPNPQGKVGQQQRRGWALRNPVRTFRPLMRDLRGHLSRKRQHPLPSQSETPLGMEQGCHSEASLHPEAN